MHWWKYSTVFSSKPRSFPRSRTRNVDELSELRKKKKKRGTLVFNTRTKQRILFARIAQDRRSLPAEGENLDRVSAFLHSDLWSAVSHYRLGACRACYFLLCILLGSAVALAGIYLFFGRYICLFISCHLRNLLYLYAAFISGWCSLSSGSVGCWRIYSIWRDFHVFFDIYIHVYWCICVHMWASQSVCVHGSLLIDLLVMTDWLIGLLTDVFGRRVIAIYLIFHSFLRSFIQLSDDHLICHLLVHSLTHNSHAAKRDRGCLMPFTRMESQGCVSFCSAFLSRLLFF